MHLSPALSRVLFWWVVLRSLFGRLVGVVLAAGDFIVDTDGDWLVDADGNWVVKDASNECQECCDFCWQLFSCCGDNVSYYRSTEPLDTGNQKIEGICGELSELDPANENCPGATLITPDDLSAVTDCNDASCPPCETCYSCSQCCIGDDTPLTVVVPAVSNANLNPPQSDPACCPGQDPDCVASYSPAVPGPCDDTDSNGSVDCPECLEGCSIANYDDRLTKHNNAMAALAGTYTLYRTSPGAPTFATIETLSCASATNGDGQLVAEGSCTQITVRTCGFTWNCCSSVENSGVVSGVWGHPTACVNTTSHDLPYVGNISPPGCGGGMGSTAGDANVSWNDDCGWRCRSNNCTCTGDSAEACDPTANPDPCAS